MILSYVEQTQGLQVHVKDNGKIQVHQTVDNKLFQFQTSDLLEVIPRTDSEGKSFVQVNFRNSNKVLFTDSLIGFKPVDTLGLDMSRIPKVVTTPDLVSVFEAVEESLSSDTPEHEVDILKKVYFAILTGGEKVGFNLTEERQWILRLMASKFRATA